MKRNLKITTAVAATLALSVAGCSKSQPQNQNIGATQYTSGSSAGTGSSGNYNKQICVDKNNVRVRDDLCRSNSGGGGGSNAANTALLYYILFMRNGASVPAYGSPVREGTYTRTRPTTRTANTTAANKSSAAKSQSTTVTRGGWGSSGSRSVGS